MNVKANYKTQNWVDPKTESSKTFLADALDLSGTEISINRFSDGQGYPFVHAHKEHEEVYYIISGEGIFHIDGEEFPISEGSFIKVSPNGHRALRAAVGKDIVFMCIQSMQNSISKRTIKDGYLIENSKASWHK